MKGAPTIIAAIGVVCIAMVATATVVLVQKGHSTAQQTSEDSVTVYENGKHIAVKDRATLLLLRHDSEQVLMSTNHGLYELVSAGTIANAKKGLAVEVNYGTPHRFTTGLGPVEIGGMLVTVSDFDATGKVFTSTVYLRSWDEEAYESGPRTTLDPDKVGQLKALLTTLPF